MYSPSLIMPNAPAQPMTIPLTVVHHRTAEAFSQQHSDAQKAIQVYLNTLSVQAVHDYLAWLDIPTRLEDSQSWNPALQVLIDAADLWVEHSGRLECRPMLIDADICRVPPQVWSTEPSIEHRIGYVVVRLNSELTEAELLGFVPQVETEWLSLEKLQSIDDLPNYLYQLTAASSQMSLTRLSDWFHTVTDTSWKTLELLLEDWQPAFSFRTPQVLSVEPSDSGIKRGKLLAFPDCAEAQVLLLLEVTPVGTEYQIKLELCPIGKEVYLPRSLHLSVHDAAGDTVLQAESRESEGLEFQFSGELGERFSVKVSFQGCDWIEEFEI